jgi:hypothetical protein
MTGSDRWGLLVSEVREKSGYRFVAGLDWVPGMAQVGLLAFSLFFCCCSFSYFLFSISFTDFV